MNITRILPLRAFLLITLLILFACLTYGTEGRPPVVHISQINFLPDDFPQDSFDKELLVVQKFLKAHETEVRVGVYDLQVFRAIDQARARLQKADRDLETLRKELSYKEAQAKLGRRPVEFRTAVVCSKCKQSIVSGQGYGYVCFKIPGMAGYHFFHRRFRTGDCWDDFLRESR